MNQITKRILVTGSRRWTSFDIIRETLLAHGPGIVVHGACIHGGADSIAAAVAEDLGWPSEAHPAADHGDSLARNLHMVSLGADVALAFPCPKASGTWHCFHNAQRAGITGVVTRDPDLESGHKTQTLRVRRS